MTFMKSVYKDIALHIYRDAVKNDYINPREEFLHFYTSNAGLYVARYKNAPSISFFNTLLSLSSIVCFVILFVLIYFFNNYIGAIISCILGLIIIFSSTVTFYSFYNANETQFITRTIMNYKSCYPKDYIFQKSNFPGDEVFERLKDKELEFFITYAEKITRNYYTKQ